MAKAGADKRRGTHRTKRLVCIVEGQGELKAVPNLCSRIKNHLEAWNWFVDDDPIRQPRGRMVDQSKPAPLRPALEDGLMRAVQLAVSRPADGVLVLCDADRDCPAVWGQDATRLLNKYIPGGAVMAVEEYESWLLSSVSGTDNLDGRIIEGIRDAKGELAKRLPRYIPTIHQLPMTQALDIDAVWSRSDSFDKLVRTLASIFGVKELNRPLPLQQHR